MRVKVMMVRENRKAPVCADSPNAIFEFMRKKARRLDREHFWRIDLDARNQIVAFEVVSVGSATASIVHPRELYKGAILNSACGIVICHNHPSQETSPSSEDRDVTKRIQKAGELLGIPLVDHVVLADDAYFSFREGGLL